MPWYKLSDDEALSRKIRPLSDGAYRLNHHAGQYCARHLTDGHVWQCDWEEIALGIKAKRPKDCAAELVAAHLWHGPGDTCDSLNCPASEAPVPPDAWVKHDYWEYQPRRTQVQEQRERARQAGRMGGFSKRSAKQPAKHSASEVLSETLDESPGDQPSEVSSDLSTNARRRPVPSRPVPVRVLPLATSELSSEATAICQAFLARGVGLSERDKQDAEGMVAEFRVASSQEFVAEMAECDEWRREHGEEPIRRVIGYRERFRRLNDRLRDEGRSQRDAVVVQGSSLSSVGKLARRVLGPYSAP